MFARAAADAAIADARTKLSRTARGPDIPIRISAIRFIRMAGLHGRAFLRLDKARTQSIQVGCTTSNYPFSVQMKYFCKACQKIVRRPSTKAWIKSFCESTGKTVRLYRAK